jgi:DivIVA domain-containing protein
MAEPAEVPTSRLTPTDIQEKVFRSQAGLRGYNEREVDEFLDRVTEELARVHAENQRLREQAASAGRSGAAPLAPSAEPGQAPGAAPGGEFIAREREFLRSLATLIQGHAEAVKGDIRRAGESRAAAERASAAAPEPLVPVSAPSSPALPSEFEGAAPAAAEPERRLDPVLAHAEPGAVVAEDETIRELFWGED